MPVPELREHIRQILSPSGEVDRTLAKRMGGETWTRAALAGAFVTAVGRRFPAPPTREEVADLVARIREKYVNADALPPMLGESLVRSGFGEAALLKGMTASELTRGQTLMTYGIVNDLGLHGDALEEFLTEAAETAQEYVGGHE